MLASSSTVVPVDVSGVALAGQLETAPFFDALLPSRDSDLLTGVPESVLRPEPQLSALNEALGAANRFMEQKLKRSRRLYATFTSSNLGFARSRLKEFFHVRMKDVRQQMILDGRPVNRMFRDSQEPT